MIICLHTDKFLLVICVDFLRYTNPTDELSYYHVRFHEIFTAIPKAAFPSFPEVRTGMNSNISTVIRSNKGRRIEVSTRIHKIKGMKTIGKLTNEPIISGNSFPR